LPSVVFMRGVNVGGHKAFRPSELARRLAALRVASIGAAGTFVVHADLDEAGIRRGFQRHLPFDAPLMILPAKEVLDLVALDPFSGAAARKADGQFVSFLESRLRARPRLPLYVPEGRDWQVAIIAIHGRSVATLMRRVGRTMLYPNEAVEKRLDVAATTRGWPTVLKIQQALESETKREGEGREAPAKRTRRGS
jgi:uncharacterized protein (DUF1697 family)